MLAIGWEQSLPFLNEDSRGKLIAPDGQYRLHRLSVHPDLPDLGFVGFNSSYLVEFLRAIGNTGEVRLEFKDAQSAGQMRPEDTNEDMRYRYILMPMRI